LTNHIISYYNSIHLRLVRAEIIRFEFLIMIGKRTQKLQNSLFSLAKTSRTSDLSLILSRSLSHTLLFQIMHLVYWSILNIYTFIFRNEMMIRKHQFHRLQWSPDGSLLAVPTSKGSLLFSLHWDLEYHFFCHSHFLIFND
jgi:hypothetical protein